MSEGAAGAAPSGEKVKPNGNGLDWREPSKALESPKAVGFPKPVPFKGVVRSTFGMQIVMGTHPQKKMDAQSQETMLCLGGSQREKESKALPGSRISASMENWRVHNIKSGLGLEQEEKNRTAGLPLCGDSGGLPTEGGGERDAGGSVKRVEPPSLYQERSPVPLPEAPGKAGMKLKRGKFEIIEHPFDGQQGSGRIRMFEVQKGRSEPGIGEASSSAAGLEENPGFENEARAILKVEHLLANQSQILLTPDQQAAERSGRWGQEGGVQGLERGLEMGESLGRQEDGLGFALLRDDSLKLFSSQYRGVVAQPHGKWGAQIYDKHVRLWLGTYDTEIDAARAHDRAAVKIKGNDAMTNFRPLTAADPEGAFIAGVGRDQLIEMLRKHTFDEEMANSARLGQVAARLDSFQQPALDGSQKRHFLFEKALTPSDVGKLNRLVFPKHYAERFFPLDLDQASVWQTLQFEDERGKFWRFRYSYWNSSQSYVLTKGWSRFVKEKGLLPGDTVVFEKGHNGQLYIGYARAQSGESGPALPPPVSFHATTPSSPYEEKSCLPQRSWLHSSAPLGGSPGPPSAPPRLFGVTLTPCLDDTAPRQPLRTGSLPVKASLSPKRRFVEAFEGAPVSEDMGRQLTSVRRALSEGQTRLGGLLGGEDAEARQPVGERRLWGETLRNGFLDGVKRVEGQSGPEGPRSQTPKAEEELRSSSDAEGGSEGPGSWLTIGPPESEDELRSQVKCFVEESPYGVVVDLSQYKSTQQLKDALLDATHGRLVVYQDKDGDMILLGDEEWPFFLKTVSRIFIRK